MGAVRDFVLAVFRQDYRHSSTKEVKRGRAESGHGSVYFIAGVLVGVGLALPESRSSDASVTSTKINDPH